MSITSAAGVIALLDEPDPEVKVFALKKLDEIVDLFWHEISDSVSKIEYIYEDQNLRQKELAALVVSKVYYHFGDFDDSVTYALGAKDRFNVNDTSEYVETIIAMCIDQYVKLRVEIFEGTKPESEVNQQLEEVVNQMFKRCLDDHQYKQAVGIALEARRMDIFEQAIKESGPDSTTDEQRDMLSYSFRVCLSLVQHRLFRNTVLRALINLYNQQSPPDYISICQCLIFLDEPHEVATQLEALIKQNKGAEVWLLMEECY